MRASTHWLKQKFAKCVDALGPRVRMPTTAVKLSDAEIVARVELAGPGTVSDGYHSALLLHGTTNAGYIVQTGGYARTHSVYEPLALVITKPDGASIKRSGPTLSIYRKQGDRWLLYRDANMLAAVS